MLDENPTSGVVLRAIHVPCAMSCHVPFQFQIPALHEWHIVFAATSIITHLFTGKLLIVGHWFVEQRTTRMTAMCLLRAALLGPQKNRNPEKNPTYEVDSGDPLIFRSTARRGGARAVPRRIGP